MLRYTTDIRPGNGAGQFLQPRSPHGAFMLQNNMSCRMQAARYIYTAEQHAITLVKNRQEMSPHSCTMLPSVYTSTEHR